MPPAIASTFAILAYLGATTWLALRYRNIYSDSALSSKNPALALCGIAILFHALFLQNTIFTPAGLNLSVANTLALVAWLVAVFIVFSAIRYATENLGLLIFPFTALTVGAAFIYRSQAAIIANTSWQLDMHILLSLSAYSLLTVAAVQALTLAYQDRQLRSRNPAGILAALPPLQDMETLLFQLLAAGFGLLSLALFSGLIFVHDLFAQHLVHKTTLSIAAWLIFGVLLWGRWKYGWRGRIAIRWTLAGFAVLALAYFGSKLVLEVILDRRWG
ncbi:MAG: cytochrome c biogenesis protein CcsA [Gammaproteobacteria bacterium]|nr:cytochrome c biogenesis protein CcsA [Gammaproteobacteria bacterium]